MICAEYTIPEKMMTMCESGTQDKAVNEGSFKSDIIIREDDL
jgi:hypothetical protein